MSKRSALHEERSLIARELHDSLAQSLSYLKIQVSRLQTLLKLDSAQLRNRLNSGYWYRRRVAHQSKYLVQAVAGINYHF